MCNADADCNSNNCGYYSFNSIENTPIFRCEPSFDPLNPVIYAVAKGNLS
jgi:hypothetical protein